MGSWVVCLLLLGQGDSLQQHGVACILERLQHLWVPPEQDTLGLHAHIDHNNNNSQVFQLIVLARYLLGVPKP